MNTHITGIHAVQGATEAVSECASFDMDRDTPNTPVPHPMGVGKPSLGLNANVNSVYKKMSTLYSFLLAGCLWPEDCSQ